MTKEVFIPELDLSAFKKVGSTNLTNWQAVNELIANSVDSWISNNNRNRLDINIDLISDANLEKSEFIITDNAVGMNKEEIKNCFNLFSSNKSKDKNSEKYLGFYGFGFKGATSKIGNEITIISSDNSNTYHQVSANYKLLESGKEKGVTYTEFKHDAASKKLFNGEFHGTKIIIRDFNSPIPEEVLLYYLPISWKKYLNTNEFGLPINLKLNNTKIIAQSFNLLDETIFALDYKFTWSENGVKHSGTAKGFVGLRFENLSMATQGINLYRRGQLVKPFEHSLYMAKGVAKHNDFNYIIGELDVELSATTTKTDFNTDSPSWEAFITQSKKELKPVIDQIKNKLKNKGSEITKDKTKKDGFIASFRKDLDLDLTPKQKNDLISVESIGDPNEIKSQEVSKDNSSLIIYDWNSIKIGKQKVLFEFKAMPQQLSDELLYEVIQISDNKVNVIYDKTHELGETLTNALKNVQKNDYAKFILRVIISDAVQQTFRSKLNAKTLSEIKNKIMGYPIN